MSAAALATANTFAAPATDVRITRIVAFDLRTKRNKLAGKNARLDVHGDSSVDPMVRIYTDAGVDGLGVCRAKREDLEKLLGTKPATPATLGSQTMPMWDLLGKLAKKSVYELLGVKSTGEAPRVAVYDGSIYFADLLPQYADNWEDRFKREIDMGLELGHRAFKIKIGRGNQWMPRAEGDARDVAVVKTIRAHAGKDVLLGVDANNGYDLAGAKRFIEAIGDANLAFTEEMFPEVVEQCLAYKEFLRERKQGTLLADGETQGELKVFEPFIAAKAIDVLQADMNHFGVEGILKEAEMARPQGIRIAPHNWGSLLGHYQMLHIGAAIDNFYSAEKDPLSSEMLIIDDGYKVADGKSMVSTAPGFGITLNEERFAADAKVKFDLKQ